MLETLSLSDVLGYASIACWLGAQFPQVIENIKLQSCEGLALPFLANWLMGDISNLVGCILTHQLPFQTWLATYFVMVDFTLVAQYAYYYKPSKSPSSALSHIRSATSPAAIRRLSIDRGASRYRTLSAVASNVAAAAALAAKQEEQQVDSQTSRARYSQRFRDYENSGGLISPGLEQGESEAESPTPLLESFHSERGGDYVPKRVSWSIERTRGRASSVGQSARPFTPAAHTILPNEYLAPIRIPDTLPSERGPLTNSAESLTPVVNSRSSRASRKGSTMVFLGAWALLGFGTVATTGRIGMPIESTSSVGRVLSSSVYRLAVPAALTNSIHSRDVNTEDSLVYNIESPKLHFSGSKQEKLIEPQHEDPTPEQVLGRIFAWLCTTLYLTSRLPQIWKNYARKSVEGLSMYLFIFAFLGNSFYASSILLSPRRYLPPPASSEYIRESIPYLLGSIGTLLFDITIVSQSFCYRHRHRRHSTSAHLRALDEEEAGLLAKAGHRVVAVLPRLGLFTIAVEFAIVVSSIMASSSMPANLTAYQLRSLVLDYLCHSCYTKTARAFNRDSTVRHLDADGDEIVEPLNPEGSGFKASDGSKGQVERFEQHLKEVELRREIRTHILSGNVDEAIAQLNKHFPSVLSESVSSATEVLDSESRSSTSNVEYLSSTSTEPAHLLLNLHILAFSEACRTVPLDYPPKAGAVEINSPLVDETVASDPAGNQEYLEKLLVRAQKLYARTMMLPNPADRATYLKELEHVGGLLAYKVPEKSSISKYLSLERREAVADQINRAILKRTGKPLISTVELITRHTTVLWQAANQYGVKSRPGICLLPPKDPRTATASDVDSEAVPTFDLHHFLESKP
ncbi:hypothetical protein CVT26_015103 [Gymnopilus dilepis]|uniref:CRA domain-containing protein n=1 Tax=Gymnopilus dilepis TaxID=231916 RepID=A0A409YEP9_9AGAR|nr:hypothetical protein CVT26_015103 [Gymnopilus dilepis]